MRLNSRALPAATLLLCATEAAAHSSAHSLEVWLGKWTFDPLVVVPLSVAAVLYLRGCARLVTRSNEQRLLLGRAALFLSGIAALFVALVAPVHWLGGRQFAWHMIEHQLLMVVAPPLIVLGRPRAPMIWGLPTVWRTTVGRGIGRLTRLRWAVPLKAPGVATALHAAALWVWHLPLFYEHALRHDLFHWLQHVSFLSTALLFWWVVLRSNAAAGMIAPLAILATSVHSMLLAVLITLSANPLYPSQTKIGLTALEDQQLAGLLMTAPVGIVYLLAALLATDRALQAVHEGRRRNAR